MTTHKPAAGTVASMTAGDIAPSRAVASMGAGDVTRAAPSPAWVPGM